jgi:hypothetical protein
MGMDADGEYRELYEANEAIATLLTYPHPDWQRIAALAERVQRIADEQAALG